MPPPTPAPPPSPALLAKAQRISDALAALYPSPPASFLHNTDAFSLLVAVVLSAQCTDAKVNQVTPALFALAPTPRAMAQLGESRIRELIRPLGLAAQKARALAGLSRMIDERHGGVVPRSCAELETLPGVGHKTASVVVMQAFGEPAFPVDTHVHRLAQRWGVGGIDVRETEALLKAAFPDEASWAQLHLRMILFGREYCAARRHEVDACPVCSWAAVPEARQATRGGKGGGGGGGGAFKPFGRSRHPEYIRYGDNGDGGDHDDENGGHRAARQRPRQRQPSSPQSPAATAARAFATRRRMASAVRRNHVTTTKAGHRMTTRSRSRRASAERK